jgi:hypothetical protein
MIMVVFRSSTFLPAASSSSVSSSSSSLPAGSIVVKKYVMKKNPGAQPLEVTGWEGLWGTIIGAIILLVVYFIAGDSAGNHHDNVLDAFAQMRHSDVLLVLFVGMVGCSGLFGWSSTLIILYMGPTARAMLGALRIVLVYGVAVSMGWEQFHYLQPVGFTLLIFGLLMFLDVVKLCDEPRGDDSTDARDRDQLVPTRSLSNSRKHLQR